MDGKLTVWLYVEDQTGQSPGDGWVYRFPKMSLIEAKRALLAAGCEPVDHIDEQVARDEQVAPESDK